MTRILLPTDFSKNSLSAIRYGLRLFKDIKCTFYLLNTYMPPVYHTEYLLGSPAQIGLGDILQENSKTGLEEIKQSLESEYSNPLHSFVTHSAFNVLSNEVASVIEAEKINLIIMGTQGATGAQEILFGTNSVHVLKNSKCPVLLIPSGFAYEAPEVILFPTDYEVALTKDHLSVLLKIMNEHVSEVNVLHVSTGYELTPAQKQHKSQLEKLFKNKGLFHDVGSNEIIVAVNNFQIKQKINLLVMVQNKHTFFERLFIEPVIKKIGFHVTIPFLVIPQS